MLFVWNIGINCIISNDISSHITSVMWDHCLIKHDASLACLCSSHANVFRFTSQHISPSTLSALGERLLTVLSIMKPKFSLFFSTFECSTTSIYLTIYQITCQSWGLHCRLLIYHFKLVGTTASFGVDQYLLSLSSLVPEAVASHI